MLLLLGWHSLGNIDEHDYTVLMLALGPALPHVYLAGERGAFKKRCQVF